MPTGTFEQFCRLDISLTNPDIPPHTKLILTNNHCTYTWYSVSISTGQCGFLHSQQMDFIIRDDYNKMVGIRKAGFATVPYGGKKPPGTYCYC